ncbi:OmpP1/FadL family transporter [Melioribacter sp. OK-6-Me]|uniref:OmpP1/FadL family transporter n=1 Tax=unclassified Melioribacter TaxID=2627329 RepID=UPI003ED90661
MSKKIFILIFISLFTYNINWAQNYNDALRLSEADIISGARSLSMGNAYTALSNDFSAALFNPAGFALIKKSQFNGSLNYNLFDNKSEFFNKSDSYSNGTTRLNQFGIVLPFPTYRGSFVLALGYNQFKEYNYTVCFDGYNAGNNSMIQDLTNFNDDIAYLLGLSYPVYDNNDDYLYDETRINGGLNQSGKILQEGKLNNWSLSAALEIQRDLYLGVTLNIIGGDFRRDRQYWEEDLRDNYPAGFLLDPAEPATSDFQAFYLNDIIKWNISAWNLNLGLLSKVNKNLSIGFAIKTPRKYTIKESYFVDASSDFGSGTSFYLDPPIENRLEYEITTPYEFSAGAAYNNKGLTLSADVTLVDYSQMEFVSGLDRVDIESNNRDIQEFLGTVFNLNFGAEYYIPKTNVALRGGFILMPSPYKDDPSDYDKKYLTMGIGYESKNISIDLAYAMGWWKDIGDNYGSNISRIYQDISRNNFILGLKYNF